MEVTIEVPECCVNSPPPGGLVPGQAEPVEGRRMTPCLLCDEPFTPVERHPMVTSAWCAECWATIRERLDVVGLLTAIGRAIPALRAEEV